MASVIMMLAIGGALSWIGLVNRVAYTINRSWNFRVNRIITRQYSRRIFSILSTYMNFRYAGEPASLAQLPERYLVLSNHQSLLDIPLLMCFLGAERLRFIAKAELGKHVPVVSLVLRSDGHCLVSRTGSPSIIMKTIDRFAERCVSKNWIPVIFPEGTRSRDGSLGPFHAAGFRRFVDRAPMPVAVVAIDGGWRTASLRGMASRMRGGSYRVKVLKVFPAPEGKADQVRILEEGRLLIQEQLDKWRSQE